MKGFFLLEKYALNVSILKQYFDKEAFMFCVWLPQHNSLVFC